MKLTKTDAYHRIHSRVTRCLSDDTPGARNTNATVTESRVSRHNFQPHTHTRTYERTHARTSDQIRCRFVRTFALSRARIALHRRNVRHVCVVPHAHHARLVVNHEVDTRIRVRVPQLSLGRLAGSKDTTM